MPYDSDVLKSSIFFQQCNPITGIIDSMNHVLKTAVMDRKENLQTYFDPTLPLAQKLVPTITAFIQTKF